MKPFCPLCRTEAELLDPDPKVVHFAFCYGCQSDSNIRKLKCGDTHGMCDECMKHFCDAVVERPADLLARDEEQASINFASMLHEEQLMDEFNAKIMRKRRILLAEHNKTLNEFNASRTVLMSKAIEEHEATIATYESIQDRIRMTSGTTQASNAEWSVFMTINSTRAAHKKKMERFEAETHALLCKMRTDLYEKVNLALDEYRSKLMTEQQERMDEMVRQEQVANHERARAIAHRLAAIQTAHEST
jgi:hypothetical protein